MKSKNPAFPKMTGCVVKRYSICDDPQIADIKVMLKCIYKRRGGLGSYLMPQSKTGRARSTEAVCNIRDTPIDNYLINNWLGLLDFKIP